MYQAAPGNVEFPRLEKSVLEFWQQEKIFEHSLKLSDREHIFYDGPPFPTGNPHHGTIFVSILKDSMARFFTMAGYSVPRRWGWDCHGLPIENAVEKKLGIKNKSEIESKIGLKAFNDECREFVGSANEAWELYINKIGRWVDYENSYRTMQTSFMESVLWVFKESYQKGFIYKDYRVTPYCYQCETALSISDTRESDSTRPRQDPAIVVKFKLVDDGALGATWGNLPTYFLAWTTTPWTLTSNLALAVGADYSYSVISFENENLILATNLIPTLKTLWGSEPTVVSEVKGQQLIGQRYEPLYPYFKDHANAFRVIAADFVTLDDGVGIVHCAPAFGEDDYWACRREKIAVKNPVDASGRFTSEVKTYMGRNVHEVNKDIIKDLKSRHAVVDHKTIEHNYPHCWRCRTPLIYRAMDAWYFAVEKIKDRLIQINEDINWVPEHLKYGRFGKWLSGARDWNISRSRFWGTPIPVWECTNPHCGETQVVGSLKEIKDLTGQDVLDLHKEYLDPLVIKCEKCRGDMRRVPEVLDCWFESGSMPYGQCHYPFENKEWFEAHFPCDFIVEYPGQIRGWFYYLHVLATALFDRPAFRNCVVHGTLLAADGTKISKSKKNYTDPMNLIDKNGADALRIYLLSSQASAMGDMNFKDQGITDQIKEVLLPLWNAYSFFVTYANIDNFQGDPEKVPQPSNQIDNWILAKLFQCEKEVKEAFSSYHLNHTLSPVLDYLESYTNWYIRQSRDRFWRSGESPDKNSAYETLYYTLVTLVKLLAPSAPFIADHIFKNLTAKKSVHLSSWPQIPASFANPTLIEEIALARTITSLGLSIRQKLSIKVRQPLSLLQIALPKGHPRESVVEQFEVLKKELNVKGIEIIEDPSQLATLRAVPNARVLGPKYGKDMQKIIKGARLGQIKDSNGQVIVSFEKESWTLDPQDIEIGYEGKEGFPVASEKGILVALKAMITPELKEEGVANDLNRLIQNMRKDAGYEIADRICLEIDGDLKQKWRTYLADSALASFAEPADGSWDLESTVELDGRHFKIRISHI